MIKIAPSILSADFGALGLEISRVEKAGADLIHVDVMDGHFVPNITIGPLVVSACRKATALPLDVHLMIENPDRYIPAFAKAGADLITFHVEASGNIGSDIRAITALNAKAGLVVNPDTAIEPVFEYLDRLSLVLIMSVNPGFEKQRFIPAVLPKIKKLREEIARRSLAVDIEVDGGINQETAKQAVAAGANILVAGSAIFYAQDYGDIIRQLRGN
jgi:ribulose-phosphate 3-epimerase